jgi:hypothetical protein
MCPFTGHAASKPCQQEIYRLTIGFRLTWSAMGTLLMQNVQQSMITEPICRMIERICYGEELKALMITLTLPTSHHSRSHPYGQ